MYENTIIDEDVEDVMDDLRTLFPDDYSEDDIEEAVWGD